MYIYIYIYLCVCAASEDKVTPVRGLRVLGGSSDEGPRFRVASFFNSWNCVSAGYLKGVCYDPPQ